MDQTRRYNLRELLKLAALASEVQYSASDLFRSRSDAIKSTFRKLLKNFANVVCAGERDEEQQQEPHLVTTTQVRRARKQRKESERKEKESEKSTLFYF